MINWRHDFFKFIETQLLQNDLKTSTEDMISLNSLKHSYFKNINLKHDFSKLIET